MKKTLMSAAAVMTLAFGLTVVAQAQDTLKKIKDSGAITLGVRESSGALAYTLGDGKYVGFHNDVWQKRHRRHPEAARHGQARRQVPAGHVAEPHSAGAERHRRPRVRLDHQQRRAPEGRRVRDDHLRRRSAHRRQGQLGHHLASPT